MRKLYCDGCAVDITEQNERFLVEVSRLNVADNGGKGSVRPDMPGMELCGVCKEALKKFLGAIDLYAEKVMAID